MRKPTIELNQAHQKAFDFFNGRLFGGTLPKVMLTFSRNSNVIGGYFSPAKWRNDEGDLVHEIAINANHMDGSDIVKLMHILIHEMIHLWQWEQGKPSRNGYHNNEWIEKAKRLGLKCKRDDGKEDVPGQAVQTFLIPKGKAEIAIAELPEDAILPWMAVPLNPEPPTPSQGQGESGQGESGQGKSGEGRSQGRSGKRAKYTCPVCGLNAWAKPGAALGCLTCNVPLVEAKI